MIIARTPFRISFMGGGTDLPSFFGEEEGMVVSTTINKFMHITVNDRFDNSYRLSYSKTEICNSLNEIEHPIFKSVLARHAPERLGLEIISMADMPAGTGLGSSSSFTVSLIHALKAHLGIFQTAQDLAQEACRIEIDELKEPIGKQDQYAAAVGGLQSIRFLSSGQVIAEPIICSQKTYADLEGSTLLFFTGFSRSASQILKQQRDNTKSKMAALREMKKGAERIKKLLEEGGSLETFGKILHEGWLLKKSLAEKISSNEIDSWYQRGLKAGAYGGKILGAGGGGFLMFIAPPEKQPDVIRELKDLRLVPVKFEKLGSRILFVG